MTKSQLLYLRGIQSTRLDDMFYLGDSVYADLAVNQKYRIFELWTGTERCVVVVPDISDFVNIFRNLDVSKKDLKDMWNLKPGISRSSGLYELKRIY